VDERIRRIAEVGLVDADLVVMNATVFLEALDDELCP
jgi:hypothetical protein